MASTARSRRRDAGEASRPSWRRCRSWRSRTSPRSACRAPGARLRPLRSPSSTPAPERRLPAGARRLRGGQDRRRRDHRARAHPARHRDPRGRALRHRVRPRPGGRRAAAVPPPAVLLRPAPRALRGRRPVDTAGGRHPRRPGLRARRRAGSRRRRARRQRMVMVGSQTGAVLAGRRGLPALRPRLLRCLHPDGLDVRRPALQRLRRLRHARRDRGGHRRCRSGRSATASATSSTASTSERGPIAGWRLTATRHMVSAGVGPARAGSALPQLGDLEEDHPAVDRVAVDGVGVGDGVVTADVDRVLARLSRPCRPAACATPMEYVDVGRRGADHLAAAARPWRCSCARLASVPGVG